MRASLKNYRQSPRKVRLVASAVRGQSVPVALAQLSVWPKRAASPIAKLIKSAAAGHEPDKLMIKEIRVDQAPTLKRSRPRARGSASRINKRQSHISIKLEAIS